MLLPPPKLREGAGLELPKLLPERVGALMERVCEDEEPPKLRVLPLLGVNVLLGELDEDEFPNERPVDGLVTVVRVLLCHASLPKLRVLPCEPLLPKLRVDGCEPLLPKVRVRLCVFSLPNVRVRLWVAELPKERVLPCCRSKRVPLPKLRLVCEE